MSRTCDACGEDYEAKRSTSRFCSSRCRSRGAVADVANLPAQEALPGGVRDATLTELTEAGRADSALGRSCLALAARLDNPGMDTGSAMAAVARQLEALMREATKGAAARTAPGQLRDELAARRSRQGA